MNDKTLFSIILLTILFIMPVFGADSPVFNDIGGIVGSVSGVPMLAPILGHGLRDAFYIAEYEKFYSIAEKYINSGAYDLALVNLDKSLENFNETDCQNFLQSDLSNIYSEKGRVQILLKRYNESEKWFDSAIEANTQNKYAWNNKGVALGNLGQYNNAIKCYDNALAIDRNFALAYNNRNVALQASQSYNANNWQGNQINEGSQVTPNVSSDIGDDSPSVWFIDNSGNKLFDAQCNVGESVYRMISLPYSGDVKSVIVQGQKTKVTDLGYMAAGDHTTYIITGPGDEGSTALSYILLNDHPSNEIKLYIQPSSGLGTGTIRSGTGSPGIGIGIGGPGGVGEAGSNLNTIHIDNPTAFGNGLSDNPSSIPAAYIPTATPGYAPFNAMW